MLLDFSKYLVVLFLSLMFGCTDEPPIDDLVDLDGVEIYDPSLDHPEDYLLSKKILNPTDIELNTPVVITIHGFSASTWEWDEFCEWSRDRGSFLTSQILLGGHGMTYEVFKNSTWEDWQQPILREYRLLDSIGYRNICFAASSTGAPLILEAIRSGKFAGYRTPDHFIMIDPIVLPSNKMLSMIGFVGPIIGYTETLLDSAENGHYYKYRPQEALNQLLELIELTRHNLEDGITLPTGISLHVYKSIKDPSADPISALLIYKGITTSFGKPSVTMVESSLHVFTYLKGRNSYTEADKALQMRTFEEIESVVR